MAPIKQPTSLVKFTSADTALKILTDAKLRWSAPLLFQDPFELDHRSVLNFDTKMFLAAAVKATLAHIFSRDEPRGTSSLIKAVRRWRAEDRFESEEEAQEVLAELLQGMVKQREPELLTLLNDWKKYAGGLRILSLIDGHDNTDYWDQYADRHCGVAIRFACGEDYTLEKPLPVEYSDLKPEITTLGEQIEALIHQNQINPQAKFQDKFLVKGKVNGRGKEWRLFKNDYPIPAELPNAYASHQKPQQSLPNSPPPSSIEAGHPSDTKVDHNKGWYDDIQFGVSEVRAIYLGANISPLLKSNIEKLTQTRYPKAKLFHAKVLHNKFELDFERLNGKHVVK